MGAIRSNTPTLGWVEAKCREGLTAEQAEMVWQHMNDGTTDEAAAAQKVVEGKVPRKSRAKTEKTIEVIG